MLFYPIYTLNYSPYLGFYNRAPYVLGNSVNNNSYVVNEQAMQFTVYGLKPFTVHRIFIDNIDVTNRAKQTGRLLGSGLVSTEFGTITLKYYFGSDVTSNTSVEQAAALASLLNGSKQMIIKSDDNASQSLIPITLPDYARTQAEVTFKKIVDSSSNTSLSIITTPSPNTSDVYYTPSTYSFIQTFYADPDAVGGSSEVSITAIDLFFKSKPTNTVNTSGNTQPAVTVAICEVENDSPVISKTYSKSLVVKQYDEIFTYSDASTPTTFGLSVPLKLKTGKTYGIVVINDDAYYTLWTNVTGDNLVNTNTKSPGSNLVKDGNLFARNTSGVFVARTNEDLKFNIKIARYTANTNTISFVNDNYEFLSLANSVATFISGETVYKVRSNSAGTISVNQGNNIVLGTGTSFSSLTEGEPVVLSNGSFTQVAFVNDVANNTVMTLNEPSALNVSDGNYFNTVVGELYYKNIADNKVILAKSTANTISFQTGDIIVGEDSRTSATIASVDNYSVDRIKVKTTVKDSTNGSVSAFITLANDQGTITFDTNSIIPATVNDFVCTNITESNTVILSRSNEIVNSSLYSNTDINVFNKSLKVDVNLVGTPYVSPSLPDLRLDCFTIQNDVREANTGIDQEIFDNSLLNSRHIEKRITFAENRLAEDVRLYMKAYRPIGTDIKVYARIHNSQDTEPFDDKNWTPLEYKTGALAFSSSSDQNNFIEFELGLPQYSEDASVLAGSFTTTLNSAVLNANGVDPTSSVAVGDLVKVYSELFPSNHWIGVVSSRNSTSITLSSPIDTSNVVGTGFKVSVLRYKNIAFNNINNSNISRYYNNNMAEFDNYDSMQIKIVFSSANTYRVPRVDQIQVIGVSA